MTASLARPRGRAALTHMEEGSVAEPSYTMGVEFGRDNGEVRLGSAGGGHGRRGPRRIR